MQRVRTFLHAVRRKNNPMSEKGIPSPFWQPERDPLPPDVQAEVDAITKQMQPAIQRLCKLVKEQDLKCFDITGGMYGIQVSLGVHNPNAPHPELPDDIEDMLGDPADMLRSMGIPVPPGAKVQVSAHRIGHHGATPPKPPIASPRAPQELPARVMTPPPDLIAGITTLLRQMYPTVKDMEVLGAIYSPHHNAAVEISKVMETARVRDRNEILRRMTEFLNNFKS